MSFQCSVLIIAALAAFSGAASSQSEEMSESMFYPDSVRERIDFNAGRYQWAKEIRDSVINDAAPWLEFTDEELWSMMFGNTITRSWMVWSDGFCPSCKNNVPMYTWKIDALEQPWKVTCPHCDAVFPTNDFSAFHRSGLDKHGVFDPSHADKSLLFNTAHPDSNDPLNKFGVDDGEGYIDDGNRWRFIGAYLIYGHWKQLIVRGITRLAAAYVVTGDRIYAHKAAVLLDRVADLYPTFDFKEQAFVYEKPGAAGYVSTWHDACEETREMALAYDRIAGGIENDTELVTFLSGKARRHGLENTKSSITQIRRNIEERILQDAVENDYKIHSNYPRTPIALIIMKTILDWPENREEVWIMIDEMVEKSTAVDGVTGEKGLTAYSSYVIRGLAEFIARFSLIEPDFLAELIERHPDLKQTWRFHIDTWVDRTYYPRVGDADGWFGLPFERYAGLGFTKNPGLEPSMYLFLYNLYLKTGDYAYVQVLYGENDDSADGLPHDLLAENPEKIQDDVRKIIADHGSSFDTGSVNKEEWCLAIMRAGGRGNPHAFWLDYDTGGNHSHADGMNLGLYGYGLDLMPDFGYPPVQYGGWSSPRALWYRMTAAHNTVVVDGHDLATAKGRTTLWADGDMVKVIQASAPGMIEGDDSRYERTVAMIECERDNFYVADMFRVGGGSDHAKFFHSHFGTLTTKGLTLAEDENYGQNTQMRHFMTDSTAEPGWQSVWEVEDRYNRLPPGDRLYVRYTDLTLDAAASTCEKWISVGGFNVSEETWIPAVMIRRSSETSPLSSAFVSIIEPYRTNPVLENIRRHEVFGRKRDMNRETGVAIELRLHNGGRDYIILSDESAIIRSDGTTGIETGNGNVESDAAFLHIRTDAKGNVVHMAFCRGSGVVAMNCRLILKQTADFFECVVKDDDIVVLHGKREDIQDFTVK